MCFLDTMRGRGGQGKPAAFTLESVAEMRTSRISGTARLLPGYLLPQQLSRPNFVSLLSMPDIGLSVISVTPVS